MPPVRRGQSRPRSFPILPAGPTTTALLADLFEQVVDQIGRLHLVQLFDAKAEELLKEAAGSKVNADAAWAAKAQNVLGATDEAAQKAGMFAPAKTPAPIVNRLNREIVQFLNKPDTKPFRDALAKSGFYADIRKTSGEPGWALLEKYVGHLG